MKLLILNVPYFEGMAGTKRVRNIVEPSKEENSVSILNVFFGETETTKEGTMLINTSSLVALWSSTLRVLMRMRKFRGVKRSAILYHYGYPSLKTILFVVYSKMLGYSVLFDIVEDNRAFNKEHFYSVKSRINNYISTIFIKFISVLGHGCIVISQHLYTYMNSIIKGRIPLVHIPISVDLSSIRPSAPRDLQKSYDDITLFYGGSFAPKDGIEILIRAFEMVYERNGKISLVLTGIGNSDDIEKIKVAINASPAKTAIKYLGFLETHAYNKVLESADIVCMTRINSAFANAGFPFKLGEYLASGKAIIATNIGEVGNYLVNEQSAILIPPGSVDAYVGAIEKLLNEPMLVRKIGVSGRNVAELFFNAEAHSKVFYDLVNNLRKDE